MRIVEKEEDFIRYFHMAQQEAINAFGDLPGITGIFASIIVCLALALFPI